MHVSHAIFESENCLYKYGEQIKGIKIMTWGTISGGPVNLFTWNSLYPYNYATNYGGQFQFNVMPSYYTPQQAFDIQNLFNPFYQFNRTMNAFTSVMNPFQNMQQMMMGQMAYNQGYQIGENIGLNASVQSSASNISSLKSQLEQALTSDKLTAEQKNQLRALKREVEALEDKLKDLAQLRQAGATNEQVRTALNQINSEYRELRDRIAAEADRIQAEVTNNNTTTADNGGTTQTTETTSDEAHPISDKIGELSTLAFDTTGHIVAADVDDENVREIVNTIYQKVDGIGSGKVKDYLDDNINKDNVVEVMLQWNKHYAEGYSEDDPLGFTETLMDERTVRGHALCTKILESLEARLKDYQGVDKELYNAANTKLAVARREHDSWWTSEDKMSEALNAAHYNIVLLMAKKAQQTQDAQ